MLLLCILIVGSGVLLIVSHYAESRQKPSEPDPHEELHHHLRGFRARLEEDDR